MSTPSQSGTFNLQSKRTLPREVLKWLQGLDLSYSVKDYRKDLNNGFLIGQIISRYEPSKIPTYALQNSSNAARRQNNWNMISLFFSKYNLRDTHILQNEFNFIKANTDSKSEQLYQFMCKLYSVCTKRTLSQSPAPPQISTTHQPKNPNYTTSYLLKQDGLQKLQKSNVDSAVSEINNNNNNSSNQKGFNNAGISNINRKMPGNLQTGSVVDVVNVGIKIDSKRATLKKKSWNNADLHQQLDQQDPVDNQKMVFDYLNDIILECAKNHQEIQQIFNTTDSHKPTEIIKRHTFSQQFANLLLPTFFSAVIQALPDLLGSIMREINEIWKFFIYFIEFTSRKHQDTQQFELLIQIIKNYAEAALQKQPKKISRVYNDTLAQLIISVVKMSYSWKKRRPLMSLVYYFNQDKKAVLFGLKSYLNSDSTLFMQWLSVLVQGETNVSLLQDYIYYAHQHVQSPIPQLRLSSLRIFAAISNTQNYVLIQPYFIRNSETYQLTNSEPEQIYLVISIYFRILKQTLKSKQYQSLVKGLHAANLIKAYNPQNERNTDQLKKRVSNLSYTIYQLSRHSNDMTIKQICVNMVLPYITEQSYLMQILLDYYCKTTDKRYIFSETPSVYEFKNMIIQQNSIDASLITDASNQILIAIMAYFQSNNSQSSKNSELNLNKSTDLELKQLIIQFLPLISYTIKYLNIKKVNMQIWEDISKQIAQPICSMLSIVQSQSSVHLNLVVQVIFNIFCVYFNYEMRVKDMPMWIAQYANQQALSHLQTLMEEEYNKTKNQNVKHIYQELKEQFDSQRNWLW